MESRFRPMVRYADGRCQKSILKHATIEETLMGLYEPVSDVWWASLREKQRQRILMLSNCKGPGVVVYTRRPDPSHGYEDVWLDALDLYQRCELSTMNVGAINLRNCCLCFVPVEDTQDRYTSYK